MDTLKQNILLKACVALLLLWGITLYWKPAAGSAHQIPAVEVIEGHPRTLVNQAELNLALARMTGATAIEPYQSWFTKIVTRETNAQTNGTPTPSLVNLAVMAKATNNNQYFNWYTTTLDEQLADLESGPSFELLFSMDILWDQLSDVHKLRIFELSSLPHAYYYQSHINAPEQNFDYHGAFGRHRALMAAAMLAHDPILTHPTVLANPEIYSFNPDLYLTAIMEELSPGGNFYEVERRIAGDPTYNNALAGDLGGMYDNFGYDRSEEGYSIFLGVILSTVTNTDYLSEMWHDRYRGRFYQQFAVPHQFSTGGTGANTYETHNMARIWYTQTDASRPLDSALALTAAKYQDPHMQYFADEWLDILNAHNYEYHVRELWQMLLFYDHQLIASPPSVNPTSRYFNGPGLVSMRSDWSNEATFAVFMAGEGISRRYEDANSFIIHRQTDVFPHAGARIRSNVDNGRHHWYHIRSVSKNTLRILDSQESFDVDSNGLITPLHTGTPLVNSDNLGGQIFDTSISNTNAQYPTDPGSSYSQTFRNCTGFALSICEIANIVKYEHQPGEFTYSVGDASSAYTRKIDYFERIFLYFMPGTFLVFDRVQTTSADFRKIWTVHTVDRPEVDQTPMATNHGMRTYQNTNLITLSHPQNITYLEALLPAQNQVVIRGGDTVLASAPLSSSSPIMDNQILTSDIPRWVELFAVGGDMLGSVTLHGQAEEGENITETIQFTGRTQTYLSSGNLTLVDSTSLTDNSQSWQMNQWANYVVYLRGGTPSRVVITGNDADTLFLAETINPAGIWAYAIERPLANSYYHWLNITQITTTDMEVQLFTVSIPHYFDTADAHGQLYSFSPHTDGLDDSYTLRKDIGQYTIEIEATTPQLQDNFLNVITLADPAATTISAQLVEGDNTAGALVNNTHLALFALLPQVITTTTYTVETTGPVQHMVSDLAPHQFYEVWVDGVPVAAELSSAQGLIYFEITLTGVHTYTIQTRPPAAKVYLPLIVKN